MKYFASTFLIEGVDLFDELAQFAQMAFAIGDFLVHDHTVEAFLRGSDNIFRDGQCVPSQ